MGTFSNIPGAKKTLHDKVTFHAPNSSISILLTKQTWISKPVQDETDMRYISYEISKEVRQSRTRAKEAQTAGSSSW